MSQERREAARLIAFAGAKSKDMIEFETFCYLQNQKTGCTFVETLLRKFCSERVVRYGKHGAPLARTAGKFYFISVREPLDNYLSLFNYGLDGRGELLGRLQAAGQAKLYANSIDGFADWLRFVLDPHNAPLTYPHGTEPFATQLGLVSVRFLRLAVLRFEWQAGVLNDRAAIQRYADRFRLADAVLRYESLQRELSNLFETTLRHAFNDVPAALAWIASGPRINASSRRDKGNGIALPAELKRTLIEREWYLYQSHYADVLAGG